jgi:hypothetical protein
MRASDIVAAAKPASGSVSRSLLTLAQAVQSLLYLAQICQRELQVDDVNVIQGVNLA